jgi:hypothetical protein
VWARRNRGAHLRSRLQEIEEKYQAEFDAAGNDGALIGALLRSK